MSFASIIEDFKIDSLEAADKIYRKSVLDLFSAIVIATPVDSGLLRNNWFISTTGFNSAIEALTSSQGTQSISRAQRVVPQSEGIGDNFYLFNNLPYGPRIEYEGWSGKAPEGMVRVNAVRWNRIVEINARLLTRG